MESVDSPQPSLSNNPNPSSSRGRGRFSGRRYTNRGRGNHTQGSEASEHDTVNDPQTSDMRGSRPGRRNINRRPPNSGGRLVSQNETALSSGPNSNKLNARNKPTSTDQSCGEEFAFNPNAKPFMPSRQVQNRNRLNATNRSDLQTDGKQHNRGASNRRRARGGINTSGHSNRRRDQRRNNSNEDPQCLRESLTAQLEDETYECMICFQTILAQQSIWTCKTCYRMFHISGGCITDWAKKSREEDHKWRCPMCQNKSEQIPYNYFCFCGKRRNPQMMMGEIPHSCGRICGGQRGVGCPHPCSEPCHPGPCPECPVMVTRRCCCGAIEKAIRCGTGSSVTCENVCKKSLLCKEHFCEKSCHIGECDPCNVVTSQSCFCGDLTKDVKCTDFAVKSGGFSCEKDCSGLYKCGKHICTKKCHSKALDCGACPVDPSRITSCPCGKFTQEELGSQRLNCTDPILTCKSLCSKVLSCGEQGKSHRCQSTCHNGPCPPCSGSTTVTCRCDSEKKTMSCVDFLTVIEGNGVFTCERKCKKRKSCGNHRCQEVCCVQTEHFCVQVCGKRLSCGLHNCENLCHSGQCQRCLNASFEEQFCHCGRTMRAPPVQCGTPLPVCDQPCARQHSCSHPVMHPCHSEQSCPPCAFLVDRPCYGKHEVRKNIPCYLDSVSCGRVCGLSLPCGVHNCARNCHSGDCVQIGSVCSRPCPALRRPCEHPCALPCHPKQECPQSVCSHPVQVFCECGRRKEAVKCYEAEKSMAQLRALKVTEKEEAPVASTVQGSNNVLTRSPSMEQLSCLSCNDDCKKVARNKQLADALCIVTNDDGDTDSPTVTFTETMKAEIKSSPQFVAEVEAVFIALLETLSDATNSNAMSHHFRPMPLEKRRFVHEYGQFFQLETVSFDSPPLRSVVVTAKRALSRTPLVLLSELHKYPSVLKAPGKTVLRSNINDEIKKAAEAKAKLESEESGLKIIKSERKVIRRAAPKVTTTKPLSQSNAFSLLCSDTEEPQELPEQRCVPTSCPEPLESRKGADWWSDEEDANMPAP